MELVAKWGEGDSTVPTTLLHPLLLFLEMIWKTLYGSEIFFGGVGSFVKDLLDVEAVIKL